MKKAIWKGKKSTLVVLIVLTAVIGILTVTGITYAVWQEVSSDNQVLNIPKDDYNPSEKYIVFRGLDENGNFCETDDESVISYAAVGYSGLIAELIIPKLHNGKPVVKLCTSNLQNDFQYRFNGNPIITSIVIPETVTEISASAFAEMQLLTKVEFLGDSESGADPITIGALAFANCPYLEEFRCSRTVNGERDSYLLGSL